ncbi:MAG TPA: hypothetical protein VJ385_00155 [Fibrobacteria bacterium]|nr:hypothetical protein [Fibrobacteria bacterium]
MDSIRPIVRTRSKFICISTVAICLGFSLSAREKDAPAERRDHFQKMQNTGFGLMMGGIGCGAGGILLMVTGIIQMNRDNRSDEYGNRKSSDKGLGTFLIGYVALGAGAPALITTGIILNRVGNHKRRRFQDRLDGEGGRLGLGIGPNSLRLSYGF